MTNGWERERIILGGSIKRRTGISRKIQLYIQESLTSATFSRFGNTSAGWKSSPKNFSSFSMVPLEMTNLKSPASSHGGEFQIFQMDQRFQGQVLDG